MRSSQGNPDEARAARYILKDYVNGKLLFCNPPPGASPSTFNEATHIRSLTRAIGKKRAPATRVTKNADTFVASESMPPASGNRGPTSTGSAKSNALDQEFFEKNTMAHWPHILGSAGHGKAFTRPKTFPHQNRVANDGSLLDPQQARLAALSIQADLGKKHKKIKRGKQRSGKGYDDD